MPFVLASFLILLVALDMHCASTILHIQYFLVLFSIFWFSS